jgi:hypothetical protein
MAARRAGTVERATRADLRARRLSVQTSAPAALAVRLAVLVDQEQDAKVAAVLARELRGTMTEIAKAKPVRPAADTVDEIAKRRAARRRA